MKFLKKSLLLTLLLLPLLIHSQQRADCRYIKGKTKITSQSSPSCYGLNDGSINLLTDFPGINQKDISYQLNNNSFVLLGSFSNVGGGPQRIITLNAADGCRDTMTIVIPQPDSINLSIAIDTASCQYSGSFSASASGGSGILQYSWNTIPVQTTPFLGNVPAFTIYTISVTDATGCSVFRNVAMPQPNPLKVSLLVQHTKCAGQSSGNIVLNPQNGTAPYSYSWASDASGPLPHSSGTLGSVPAGLYYATVSDATGCSYQGSFALNDAPPLRIAVRQSTKSCLTDTEGGIDVTLSGGRPGYSYMWSNNQTTSTISSLSSGDYRLIVSDLNGCQLDTTIRLRLQYPISGNISSQQVSCSDRKDGSATFQPMGGTTPFSFLWSDSAQQANATASGLDAGNYSVTATDALGCSVVGNVQIAKPLPLDAQFAVQATSCANSDDGSALVSVSGGNGNPQTLWCDGKSGMSRNDLKGGICIVSVTDSKGCTIQKSIDIPVPKAIEADKIMVSDVRCAGESNGTAECLAKGGTAPYSYRWNDANGQVTAKIVNLPKGNYTVTITDSRQCSGTQTVFIKEPLPLGLGVQTVSPKCAADKTGSFIAAATGGTGSYSYFWKNNSSSGSSSSENSAPAGLYYLSVTDANNCIFSDTFRIKVPDPIDFTLTQTFKGCSGTNSCTAEAENVSGGLSPYLFLWTGGRRSDKVKDLQAGNISLTVTDANGCTATKSLEIKELEPIKAGLAFVMPKCNGSGDGQMGIIALSGGAGNGVATAYSYLWNVVPAQRSLLATNLQGDKTYEVSITDSLGCTGTASRYLPQPQPMELKALLIGNKCAGSKEGRIEVSAKSDNAGFNFLWSDAAATTTSTISNLSSGSYTVTVSDFNNCRISETYTLKDPDSLKISSAIIENNTCRDTAKGAIKLVIRGGNGSIDYIWSNGLTTDFVNKLKTGTYTVTVTDQNKCSSIGTYNVGQPDTVRAEVETTAVSCFDYKNGSIKITATGGTGSYLYSLDGDRFTDYNQFRRLAAGKYSVFVKDDTGCLGISSAVITEPPPLWADAGEDQRIEYGTSVQLYARYSGNSGTVAAVWMAPSTDILSCIRCDSVLARPKETTILTLRVTDANGCSAEDKVTVFLTREKGVFVASAFSPNNDLQNDLLIVNGKEGTKVISFRIFDQWGEQLFEASDFGVNNKNIGWDGIYRGNSVPAGNYLWTLQAEYPSGEQEIVKGSSLLIR